MTAPLRSYADIKRRCVLGARLELLAIGFPIGTPPPLPMARTITKVQTNAIAMTPWPGRERDSWLYWGPASGVKIEGPDTFSIYDENGNLELTYRFA